MSIIRNGWFGSLSVAVLSYCLWFFASTPWWSLGCGFLGAWSIAVLSYCLWFFASTPWWSLGCGFYGHERDEKGEKEKKVV